MTDPAARPIDPDSFVGRLRDDGRWYGPGGATPGAPDTPAGPGQRRWGRHAARLLTVAVVALLVYGAAAAAINPRGEFPWQPVPPVRSEDAAYKAWLLGRLDAPPEVLVLGSSRSQKVAPDDVEAASGRTAFNLAVADSYPEDLLAVYRGVAGPGGPAEAPAEVVLGLDLNRLEPREDGAAGPERTGAAFGPLHGDGAGPRHWLAAAGRMYTGLYAQQAGEAVLQALGWLPGLVGFDADGLARYHPWERQQAAGTFDQDREIGRFLGGRAGYPAFRGLDEAQVAAVRQLVEEARADGATVRVWLTPVHPRVEEAYREGGASGYDESLAAARGLLGSLCRDGVHAHDYTDLASFGGRPEGFYDGSHMMRENTRAVVEALYEGRGDVCAA